MDKLEHRGIKIVDKWEDLGDSFQRHRYALVIFISLDKVLEGMICGWTSFLLSLNLFKIILFKSERIIIIRGLKFLPQRVNSIVTKLLQVEDVLVVWNYCKYIFNKGKKHCFYWTGSFINVCYIYIYLPLLTLCINYW